MKPTREEIEQQLLAYLEGTLPPAEAARAEVYLANTDPATAARVAGMVADRQALQGLPKLRAPHDLAERIMEQVERASLLGHPEREGQRGARRWFQPRYAAAAAIFLLAGTFSYVIIEMVSSGDNGWHHQGAVAHNPGEAPEASGGVAGKGGGGTIADGPAKGGTHDENLALLQNSKGGVGLEQANADNAPVAVTLVARDSDDAERLRTMLVSFVAEDEGSRNKEGQAVAANTNFKDQTAHIDDLGKSGGDGMTRAGDRIRPEALPAPSAPRMAEVRGTAQQYDQQSARGQQVGQAGESALERNQKLEEAQRKLPGAGGQIAAGQFQYQEPVWAQKGIEVAKAGPESRVTFAGTAGAPYHLRLRRAQLAKLTDQFAVASLGGAADNEDIKKLRNAKSAAGERPGDAGKREGVGNLAEQPNHRIASLYNNYNNTNGTVANGAETQNFGVNGSVANNSKTANDRDALGNSAPGGLSNTHRNGTLDNSGNNSFTGATTVGAGAVNIAAASQPARQLAPTTAAHQVLVAPAAAPAVATTQPAAAEAVATDAGPGQALAQQVVEGDQGQGQQKYLKQRDAAAADDYVDCIITLMPPAASK